MKNKLFFTSLFVTSLFVYRVEAQPIPSGTQSSQQVTGGATNLTSEKFEAAAKKDPKAKDATELAMKAGALWTAGNSRQISLTAGLDFRYRKSKDQLTTQAAANYGAAATAGKTVDTTVENYQLKGRYDRFVSDDLTVFLGLQGRRDRFAGLDLRTQIDPGIGYYFINKDTSNFWGEFGYDLLLDVRRDDARIKPDGSELPKTAAVHSVRLYLGLKHKFSDNVSFNTGLEYLFGYTSNPSVADQNIVQRLSGDIVLNSKLSKHFSLATSFTFRFDSGALPTKEKLDTITAISLVYTLL